MGFYQFLREQKFRVSREKLWDFISDPKNLQEITPEYMGFEVTSEEVSDKMYPGMILSYKVSPVLGIKTTWVTEITHVLEGSYFIDEQRIGPYKLWNHQHFLEPISGGTIMYDVVSYQPPYGFLGSIANSLFIKKKLNEIFDYRHQAMEDIFGTY